jgi:hypothetical protein
MAADEDFNHILGDAVFHIIQDVVIEAWARLVATVIPSALLVTCHHFVVLLALCILLVPVGVGASLVAHLVLATCCVAQHMVREALEFLHRGRHGHWAFGVAFHLFERAIDLRVFTCLVARRRFLKCVAFVMETPKHALWTVFVACKVTSTLNVTGPDHFH